MSIESDRVLALMFGPLPPEPKPGVRVRAQDFPGAGFVAGSPIDYDALNHWAEVYGWRCRFRPQGRGVVNIYYPS